MAFVFFIIIASLGFGLLFYNTIMDVYTWFDHYGWSEKSKPDKNAKIQNITSERVQYVKNKAILKTKITFSDGFYFITHKTDRDDKFLIYKIYLSDELRKHIMELAIEKHDSAVDDFISQKQHNL